MSVSHEKFVPQIESKKTEFEELKARKSELHDENGKVMATRYRKE